ncbi:MAG: acyl-CoA thioesterase [Alphaproteobacteria bacterium]|nr:acyl-CoA thioesterase [Alphaproteobacteria bacterium]
MLINRRSFMIQFGDCDPSGIVYNPRYFEWFDISLHALLARGDLRLRQMIEEFGIDGIPMVESRAKFLAPSRYGDEIVIETSVAKLHRCAFDLHHRLFNADTLAVEAFETRVWTVIDPQEGRIRARPLPAAVIARFSAAEPPS